MAFHLSFHCRFLNAAVAVKDRGGGGGRCGGGRQLPQHDRSSANSAHGREDSHVERLPIGAPARHQGGAQLKGLHAILEAARPVPRAVVDARGVVR